MKKKRIQILFLFKLPLEKGLNHSEQLLRMLEHCKNINIKFLLLNFQV